MLPVRHLCCGFVGNDTLRVRSVFAGRVEVQPPDVPVEIQEVLEFERDLDRRADQKDIQRHAALRIDDRETGAVSLEPLPGIVTISDTGRALEHLEQPARLALAARQQRFESLSYR